MFHCFLFSFIGSRKSKTFCFVLLTAIRTVQVITFIGKLLQRIVSTLNVKMLQKHSSDGFAMHCWGVTKVGRMDLPSGLLITVATRGIDFGILLKIPQKVELDLP